ncbi:MAG: NYN domain-containing protein [Desulfovibrio sp.]|jgi:hypothetical protein|nr:NYN domain-containing protein [Desulfovibrio sp.]
MHRFQNFEEIFSALYVDFDNIYTRLSEQDPALARTFATNPQRWVRWLEGHALRMMYGDGVRRRILKRCCYLNPIRYHEFRPYFIRSAFQVVDCPPLTNYGKTSADIHLVMDCMDALAHVTRFDEIIILSGDADFTPLLLRIQEHARRSLVLSVGYTSPAYAAACSWRIREDWFLSQALEDQREDAEREERDAVKTEVHHEERTVSKAAPKDAETPHQTERPEKVPGLILPAHKRVRLVETIRQMVAESAVPVPLPSIVQVLQREQEIPANWFGAGTLRDLLKSLDLGTMAFVQAGPGFVMDPERHERPDVDKFRDEFRQKHPQLYELALKAHRLTDIPMLNPEQYAALFTMLAEEVRTNKFSRTGTVRNLEDRCEDEGVPVNAAQIAFIVEAVIRGGANLAGTGAGGQETNQEKMRAAYAASTIELCRLAQVEIGERERELIESWFHPATV